MNGSNQRPSLAILILGLGFFVLALANCGGGDESNPVDPGDDPIVGPDTTAPAAVTDLRLRAPTQSSLALVWTAPGDDGTEGTAARYDIRYSKSSIDEASWDQATPVDPGFVPSPKPGGQIETIVITDLGSGQTYYFALKTSDEVPNQSTLSNCCFETTASETKPPSDITDLKAEAIDETSYALTWTAPGDDYMKGTATRYDIRYSLRAIEDDDDWKQASQVPDTPSPQPAGTSETFVITVTPGQMHFFAIKTVDELDNWSGRSNLAVGLAYGLDFWISPTFVSPGELMYIAFRATPGDFTRVSLHNWFYWFEDRACGSKLVQDLIREILPEGVHVITFDFVDPDTGEYYPADSYEMFLCYGPYLHDYIYVSVGN